MVDELEFLVSSEQVKHKESITLLKQQKESFNDYYKTEHEQLAHSQDVWNANIATIHEFHARSDNIVELNVGGTHKLTTTRATLCKVKDSVLAAMFNGKHKLQYRKGRVFLDRDGAVFSQMVSYLRSGRLPVFDESQREAAFYNELDFWQILANDESAHPIDEGLRFDAQWCAPTLRLEHHNQVVRKHGTCDLEP